MTIGRYYSRTLFAICTLSLIVRAQELHQFKVITGPITQPLLL